MRRILLLTLSSALFLSACGSSTGTTAPAASSGVGSSAEVGATQTAATNPSIAPSTVMMDGDWVVFTPAGAGFTSKMPKTPTLASSTTKTAIGDAATSLWTDEEGGNLSYYLQTSVYPAGILAAATASTVYDGAMTALSTSSGFPISASTEVTVGGHKGQLFLLAGSTGSIKAEIFIVGDTVYMPYVAFTSSVDLSLVDSFFIDFKFVA